MSDIERRRDYMDPTIGAWHGWGSPVGLGMFFVLVAVAFDVVRLALTGRARARRMVCRNWLACNLKRRSDP
jgi:hypothetical protein